MESRVKAFGHPIHPMLIVFPLGLLATAVVFDILHIVFDNNTFSIVAFWMMVSGIVSGLVAALFGFADWLAIPSGTRAKSVGLMHGVGNVAVTGLFALSAFMRMGNTDYIPSTLALILSFGGALLSLLTGWLGGELVYRLGMAVDPGANLNAPSSLSDEPAHATADMGTRPILAPTGRPEDEAHIHPEDDLHHHS